MLRSKLYEIMKAYKEEAHVKHTILFRYTNHKLIICTDHPGYMIGVRGYLVEKYNHICRDTDPCFEGIEFVETEGIV